jgi:type IV pilus assembly protein PilB
MALMTHTRSSPQDKAKPLRVGDLLVERNVITSQQLEEALEKQKESGHRKLLGETIVEMRIASEEQVLETLADGYGIPFARVSPRLADPKVIELLPREFLEKQCVLPMFLVQGKLTVAVHEPSNVFLVEEIERRTGHQVQVVAATAHDIRSTVEAYLPNANVFVIDEMMDDMGGDELDLVQREITDLADLEGSASQSPVIKLVNYLIYGAVRDKASDIHIEPGDQSLRVRYRVDGKLFAKMSPPYQMLPALVSRVKIMAGLDISERRVPQDGGISAVIDKRQVDLRISTMPGKYGEKVVIRIIDTENAVKSLEQLGFSTDMLEGFRSIARQPNGIVLVTGPTGSGKSTTLYATLGEVTDETLNVSTVEDPVEYSLAGVNQFQVNERAGFTFAGALRSLLRQDPDVIMLGEIRDPETAGIATQAALTGHLVFSTLHTNDAPSAVTRLINIGVEPYLVAASLRGVLAQRLVRRVCHHCKQEVKPDKATRRTLEKVCGDNVPSTIALAVGCPKCRDTGYAGRLGVYELLRPSDEMLDAVSRGATLQEIRRIARETGGYTSLRTDGMEKIRAGLTTVEELMTATAV